MDFFDHPYYRASKTVSRLIGRWPYQSWWERKICSSVLIFLFSTQCFAGILGAIVHSDDKEIILESIPPFIIDAGMATKYVNSVVNIKTMMKLLDRVQKNWTMYTKAEEKRILEEYSHIGRLIIYGYIVAIYVTTLVFVTEPIFPKWLNFIFQLNGTVPKKYPVPIYWLAIDMEDNFYLILCYESICIIAILTITVANDSMFIIFLQHCCALFAIVGHQLENIPNTGSLKKDGAYGEGSKKMHDIQYEYYAMCIKNHKRAIEFASHLENLYVWSFGVVVGLNMPLMSVTAFQIVTQADTIEKLIKYSMFACTQIMHLFFDCYLSQQLSDRSSAIQKHITYSEWYGMSLKTQKLVTLVTLRSQVPCRLTAGKLVLLTMETFAAIVKTSVSYFTVMISMR